MKYLIILCSILFLIPKLIYADSIDQKVNQLEECESGRRVNVKYLDWNNEWSYSSWQFQWKTFVKYNHKFHFRDNLILKDIYDRDLQRRMVIAILTTERYGWKNWLNCSKKIGLDKWMDTYFEINQNLVLKR